MVPTTPIETWKAWLAAQYITLDAPLLSQDFQNAEFDFFGKTLSGQQQQRARWKRGVQLVNGTMGEALGQLYVGKYYPRGRARAHAGDDRQPARGLPAVDHDARLDDAGHQERSAREAGGVPAEDRLPAQVEGLLQAGS